MLGYIPFIPLLLSAISSFRLVLLARNMDVKGGLIGISRWNFYREIQRARHYPENKDFQKELKQIHNTLVFSYISFILFVLCALTINIYEWTR